MLWRFDQLSKPTWHDMALRDARRAVSLALAMPAEAAIDTIPEAWLSALLEQAQGQSLHVTVMVGDTSPWAITLEQHTVKLRVERATPKSKSPPNPNSNAGVRTRASKPAAAVAA